MKANLSSLSVLLLVLAGCAASPQPQDQPATLPDLAAAPPQPALAPEQTLPPEQAMPPARSMLPEQATPPERAMPQAAAPVQAPAYTPAQTQAQTQMYAADAAGCQFAPPWVRASRALNRPVEQGGSPGRPVFTIRKVSYAEIMGDRELIEGVRLIDATGREPAPATVYNIVWTPEEVSCTARYSAPAFFDVR